MNDKVVLKLELTANPLYFGTDFWNRFSHSIGDVGKQMMQLRIPVPAPPGASGSTSSAGAGLGDELRHMENAARFHEALRAAKLKFCCYCGENLTIS